MYVQASSVAIPFIVQFYSMVASGSAHIIMITIMLGFVRFCF